jgi:VanZ family protein
VPRLNLETSFRAAGYAAILLIGVLSLVPGTLRPETGAPGRFEHFVAYMGAATILALGFGGTGWRSQGLWLVPYAAALEIAQLFVPGRHSRFSDFAVSSLGALLGIVLISTSHLFFEYWRTGRIKLEGKSVPLSA